MKPTPWNRLFQAIKKEALKIDDQQRTRFSRAHARLRVARRFQNVNLKGVSSLTERGYTTGIAISSRIRGWKRWPTPWDSNPALGNVTMQAWLNA